jgi:hypothetical protein
VDSQSKTSSIFFFLSSTSLLGKYLDPLHGLGICELNEHEGQNKYPHMMLQGQPRQDAKDSLCRLLLMYISTRRPFSEQTSLHLKVLRGNTAVVVSSRVFCRLLLW